MADEKPTPTPVRFTKDELTLVDAAKNLEDENRSQYIRRVVLEAASQRVIANATR